MSRDEEICSKCGKLRATVKHYDHNKEKPVDVCLKCHREMHPPGREMEILRLRGRVIDLLVEKVVILHDRKEWHKMWLTLTELTREAEEIKDRT